LPKSWPNAVNSASLQPTPIASRSRPPLSASSDAVALASHKGWYWAATSTLVPNPMRSVAAAAQARVSSGS
jgi:hypothetical protein